jgi:hypothetical protein
MSYCIFYQCNSFMQIFFFLSCNLANINSNKVQILKISQFHVLLLQLEVSFQFIDWSLFFFEIFVIVIVDNKENMIDKFNKKYLHNFFVLIFVDNLLVSINFCYKTCKLSFFFSFSLIFCFWVYLLIFHELFLHNLSRRDKIFEKK